MAGHDWATGAEHTPTASNYPVTSEVNYGDWLPHPVNAKLESPQLGSTPSTPAEGGSSSSHNAGSNADDEEYADPLAKKRAKNAEAARKTARLKKERQNKLEEQVNFLQRQVEGLHGKRDELQQQRDMLMERAGAAYRGGNVGRR
ncbi:hypothetical protein CYLTODRAFT_493614 [Cylindrobasidium torrendii FP15055 ss-10]|uniref:BZIP domain-containing protein n=1 Tax=Cylindrobasidium torrendii FP15055 ss-10 TaxID=1314674 RepID=A0A0D7B2P4_9AGAR|nr:hypothetical protein CYLTODRAFT_493614 [Cylindrobasidium torrendii FP15055 ss-10]